MKSKRVRLSIIYLCVAVICNLGLAIAKLYVGLRSNSVCVMLDATNSFFDIVASLITIVAFSVILKSETKENMYGFGRTEYIAGFIVSVLVVIMGSFFLYESINRIAMPTPIWFRWSLFSILAVAVFVKLGLALMFFFVNKKIKSKAFTALTLDSILDTAITSVALISLTISSMVDYAVDGIIGIVLSIIIVLVGIKMIIDAIRSLVGRSASDVQIESIKSTILKDDNVKNVGKIKLHDYGYQNFIGTAEVEFDDIDLNNALTKCVSLEKSVEDTCEIKIDIIIRKNLINNDKKFNREE